MTYFTKPSDLAPVTKARSVDINNLAALIAAAFGKLPEELDLKMGTVNYAVNTGPNGAAYSVVMASAIKAYADGLEVKMRPVKDNTGACTLNVNGLGNIAIKRADGTDPQAGDILGNVPITLIYQAAGNLFRLPPVVNSQIVQAASASAAASDSAAAAAASAAIALKTLAWEAVDPPANPIDGQEWIDAGSGRRFTFIEGQWAETYASQVIDQPTLVDALSTALQLADYAALRAYTGPRQSVYVTGYLSSAAPSGIAGMFVRDDSDTATTDNGGTVIVASNGKRWKRTHAGDVISDKWFGSVGNGVTDDTAAIQAAMNYAQASGKRMVLSSGDHVTTATLNITAPIVMAFDGTVRPNHSDFAFTLNQSNSNGPSTFYNVKIKWFGTFGTSLAGGFNLKNATAIEFVSPHLWGLGKSAFQVSEPGVVGLTIINPKIQEHVAGDIFATVGNPYLTTMQMVGGMLQYTANSAKIYDGLTLNGAAEIDTVSVVGTAFESCRSGINALNLRRFKFDTAYFEGVTTGIILGTGFSTNKPADGVYMTPIGAGVIESCLFSAASDGVRIEGITKNLAIRNNFFDANLANSINVNTGMHLGLHIGNNDDNSANKVVGYPSVIDGMTARSYTKVIVDPCNSLTGWSKTYDPTATGAFVLDTGWDNKNQAIKATVTGDQLILTKTVSLDLSNYDYFVMPFYVTDRSTLQPPQAWTDPSVLQGCALSFFTGGAAYSRMSLSQIDYGPYPWLKPGWNYLTLPKAAFKATGGGATWSGITSVTLSVIAQTGKTATVKFGGIFGIKLTGALPFEVPNNLYA